MIIRPSSNLTNGFSFHIKSVFDRHKEQSDVELIEFTCTLPEWKKYEPLMMSINKKYLYHIKLKEIVDAIAEETGNKTLWDHVRRDVAEMRLFADIIADDRI